VISAHLSFSWLPIRFLLNPLYSKICTDFSAFALKEEEKDKKLPLNSAS
jgi:hypothetical protein